MTLMDLSKALIKISISSLLIAFAIWVLQIGASLMAVMLSNAVGSFILGVILTVVWQWRRQK